jgi:hypothetical protein
MNQQDHAAWRLYCIASRHQLFRDWDEMPVHIKTYWRLKATAAMLISLAPHRHP